MSIIIATDIIVENSGSILLLSHLVCGVDVYDDIHLHVAQSCTSSVPSL